MLIVFVLWTVLVCTFDVKPIGPNRTSVGLATINGFFHRLTGVNMTLYNITDWLGLIPIFFAMSFAVLGLVQWLTRRDIRKVDYDILGLGVFYIAVVAVYILFEIVVINYRPTLIEGFLEVSYPSSTTMLVMCVMPTAIMQFNVRIRNSGFKKCVNFLIKFFVVFMVIGRFISGVHWFSDIVGGVILSAGLVMMYYSVFKSK